ncbi:uncharacterized protein BDZ99DRAFT_227044 [Mytilinidion resinicola]|uniref:Uncharacterized protein n=1 Tax=Mytilinidion resinicola TaxID=574789 RepID=A0A6A6Z156_9PEZI|nr:uncharacterized protein BDZ99DRAFT_227044 [Mytilinidion resinicola]KAF2813895.1 hypothetical protein BDZ99DRAFT_227044 [Mytilinidion resinicola]
MHYTALVSTKRILHHSIQLQPQSLCTPSALQTMTPVATSFIVSRELNESVAMSFVVPNVKGSPSAWSDTITTTIFGVAALITASISIWQAHRYLHGVAQMKQAQSKELEKATQMDDNSYRQPGLSRSKTIASTISGETVRTTLDEFYGLEAQSPSRGPVEYESRKSEKGKTPESPIEEPSSARVRLGPLLQPFFNHNGSPSGRPDDVATVLAKFCELFFHMTEVVNPPATQVDSREDFNKIALQDV